MPTAKSRKRPKHFAPSLFLDMRSTYIIISRNIIREIVFSFPLLFHKLQNMSFEFFHGTVVHAVEHICIYVQSHVDIPVPEPVFQHYCRNSRFDASCCKCMPKSMLPSLTDACLFTYAMKKAVHLAGRYQILLEVIIKYQIERVILNSFQSFLQY